MQEDDQASRQELLPITKVPRRGLPHFGLVCGDPARQHRISQLLSGPVELARTREYTTSVGSWKGLGVVVSSHGVGASGALLMFHELMMAGVTTIIRVGTCGSLRQEIEDGDLIIAEAAVRADGVTDQLVTLGYPAFSSPKVVLALMRAAKHSSATLP